MKKLIIAMTVGAAALLGGSAANAADNTVKAKAAPTQLNPPTSVLVFGTIGTMAIVTTARIIEATAMLRGRTMAVMAAVTVGRTMAAGTVMAAQA
jgi:hypothetical protein